MKDLDAMVDRYGEAGLIDALYYWGAQDTLEIIRNHEFVDKPMDFVRILEIKQRQRSDDPWE